MPRRLTLLCLCALALAACAGPEAPPAAGLPPETPALAALPPPVEPLPEVELKNYGPAPELTSEVWLNVDQPLRLSELRGQVVLIDMWTFG